MVLNAIASKILEYCIDRPKLLIEISEGKKIKFFTIKSNRDLFGIYFYVPLKITNTGKAATTVKGYIFETFNIHRKLKTPIKKIKDFSSDVAQIQEDRSKGVYPRFKPHDSKFVDLIFYDKNPSTASIEKCKITVIDSNNKKRSMESDGFTIQYENSPP